MFTLAHLSDAHLGPLPPVPIRALANKRMTGFLNWQRKRRFIHDPALLERIVADLKAARPDHIAATGDFANIGLPAEFAHARQWLSGLGEPRDVTAVPGNHDAYVRGSLEAMQATLADYMRGDGGDHGFPFVRRRDGVALIVLSTGIPTPPFMATGALGASQLDRFAAALDQNGNEGLFCVVLIHHPPISEGPVHKRLIDAV
ncbi:MAG: metallophosphoesterase, partial [Pseudolabrys sp.]|nr:metallophosphoesterase [Pseudolabrys sp.]